MKYQIDIIDFKTGNSPATIKFDGPSDMDDYEGIEAAADKAKLAWAKEAGKVNHKFDWEFVSA